MLRSPVPAAMLTLGLALLVLAPSAMAVVVPLSARTADAALLASACAGQGSHRVCHPLSEDGRAYVQCGATPMEMMCPAGQRFDYTRRRCMRASSAQICPRWYCPAGPGPALSRPYGTFGMPGNLTVPLYKKESFTIECPVHGHCLGGMVFNIHVECPAPADRTPFTFEIDFEETVMNEMMYPKRMADLWAFCGDRLFIEWDEPIHLVQLFNTSAAARPLWQGMSITPYPPQPVYMCTTWPANFMGFPIPLPGDEVVMDTMVGAQNATWTANTTETAYFACPLANHCRLGQVFKVTVTARPDGVDPVAHTLPWLVTGNNYEDMNLHVGDSITFVVPPNPPMAHGVYKVPASRIRMM